MFSHDRNTELPNIDLLIVRRRDKALAVIDEGKTVDGSQMLLVLLNDLLGVSVVLKDLLVRAASKENVLLII